MFYDVRLSCVVIKRKDTKKTCSKFSQKQWSVNSIGTLIRKIDETGSIDLYATPLKWHKLINRVTKYIELQPRHVGEMLCWKRETVFCLSFSYCCKNSASLGFFHSNCNSRCAFEQPYGSILMAFLCLRHRLKTVPEAYCIRVCPSVS